MTVRMSTKRAHLPFKVFINGLQHEIPLRFLIFMNHSSQFITNFDFHMRRITVVRLVQRMFVSQAVHFRHGNGDFVFFSRPRFMYLRTYRPEGIFPLTCFYLMLNPGPCTLLHASLRILPGPYAGPVHLTLAMLQERGGGNNAKEKSVRAQRSLKNTTS